jgi:hypothetical protein
MRNNYDFGKVNNARVDLITRGLLKLLVEQEPRPELVPLALTFCSATIHQSMWSSFRIAIGPVPAQESRIGLD